MGSLMGLIVGLLIGFPIALLAISRYLPTYDELMANRLVAEAIRVLDGRPFHRRPVGVAMATAVAVGLSTAVASAWSIQWAPWIGGAFLVTGAAAWVRAFDATRRSATLNWDVELQRLLDQPTD